VTGGTPRRASLEQKLELYLQPGYHDRGWTNNDVALLGKLPDEKVRRHLSVARLAVD
jgi:hypothetical protein